jgi:hypothetical protein
MKQNKYYRYYTKICERAKTRRLEGYGENHHILPKSLGGLNEKTNIVRLTAREHYIAHLCLVRCTEGVSHKKMLHAARYLIPRISKRTKTNGRLYEQIKTELAQELTKQVIPQEMRVRISQSLKVYYQTHSHSCKGRIFTEEQKIKLRHPKSRTEGMGCYARTNEIRQKISESRIGKGAGECNAMNNPENRAKVGASKVGRKLHIGPNGERKMFIPGTAPEEFHVG